MRQFVIQTYQRANVERQVIVERDLWAEYRRPSGTRVDAPSHEEKL